MVTNIKLQRIVLSDIFIFCLIYFIPTFSHMIAFPIYQLDPMRIAVLGSLIFLASKKNAYLLALTLPLFSYFVGGHPVILKSVLITTELIVNLIVLSRLELKLGYNFWTILSSIIVSKIMYYGLKYISISMGLLDTSLFDTKIVLQLSVAVLISLTYTYMRRVVK